MSDEKTMIRERKDAAAHNTLQARFLDNDFCLATMRLIEPEIETWVADEIKSKIISHAGYATMILISNLIREHDKKRLTLGTDIIIKNGILHVTTDGPVDLKQSARNEAAEIKLRELLPPITLPDTTITFLERTYYENAHPKDDKLYADEIPPLIERANNLAEGRISIKTKCVAISFEVDGWDVMLRTHAIANEDQPDEEFHAFKGNDRIHWRSYLEVRPTLGDEYPTVLRQMKAYKKRVSKWAGARMALVVGKFTAAGVTLHQVKSIFEKSGFKLVLVSEIDALFMPQ